MFQGLTSNRSFVLIGAALALPIVLLVVIQLSFAFSREREEVEAREDAEVVTGAEGVASGAPPAELIPRP